MTRDAMTQIARHMLLAMAALMAAAIATTAAASSWELDRPSGHRHEDGHDVLGEQDYRQAPRNILLWGELAKVHIVRGRGRYVATFLPSVLAYEGRTVTLLGFMAAVHGRSKDSQFLLSDRRFLCGGCDSTPGPESIVEVNTLSKVSMQDRPVLVRGRLELVRGDANGLVYRLSAARVIQRLQ